VLDRDVMLARQKTRERVAAVAEVVTRQRVVAMMASAVRAAITTALARRMSLSYVLCCILRFLMSPISDTAAKTGYVSM
jgi:hypothetical protein